ncbi:MAG: endonuclease/exonuclease/phosphatase family protein [Acidimicrobiia bacterium]
MTYNQTGVGSGLRTALIIITLGLGGLVSVATVAGFFGSMWWVFDLAANFRWQMLWIALICAILYALTAKGIATVVFIGAVVVNGFVIAPAWIGSQPAGTGEDGVTIVQVDMFGGVEDTEHALRWLFDTEADVIVASGVTTGRMEALTVEGSPYQVLVSPESEDHSGQVILARADLPVTTTLTEGFAEPVYTVSIPSGNTTIDLVTGWGRIASDSTRALQLEARLATIESVISESSNPVTVVGDLGATRFTHGMRTLRSTTGVRDATEGSGYLSTWPVSDLPVVGGWVGIPIDVVLMSAELTPLELTTGPDIGVSHLPVTVTVGPTNGS